MARFELTNKGKKELVHNGYRYQLEKATPEKSYYKCVKYYTSKCSSRVHLVGNDVQIKSAHSHGPDAQEIQARKVVNNIKKKAVTTSENPSTIIANAIANVSQATKCALPNESLLKKIRRKRKVEGILSLVPSTRQELVIPESFNKLEDGRQFLLFYSGFEEKRVIVFSTASNLDFLDKSSKWHMDGTFSAAPFLFSQLFTLHAVSGSSTVPVVFALLPNKSQETYLKLAFAVKSLKPSLNPTNLMADFERAALNAFNAVFPSAAQSGCFFHYKQAIWRKIQQLGLSERYSSDESFSLEIKKIVCFGIRST